MAAVTGLFKDRESAERAFQAVIERGYDAADLNLFMSHETHGRDFPDAEQKPATSLGGPVGGTLGTIGAALAALGTVFVLPGLGFVVAGPIAAALTAAGSVGLVGGLIGALTNWGIPDERIEHYEAGLRRGGIVMGVTPRSEEDAAYFEQQWKASGGEHVHSKT